MSRRELRVLVAAEAIALTFALGMATFTDLTFLLYLLGLSYPAAAVPALAMTVAASLMGGWLLWRTRSREPAPKMTGLRWLASAGLLLGAASVAFSAWLAVHWPLMGWDSWAEWGLKARMFAHGHLPYNFFHSRQTVFMNPRYPLNIPLAEAAFFRWLPAHAPVLSTLLGVASFAAILLLMYCALSRLYGLSVAGLSVGLLATVPYLPRVAASGYADIPLAMYFTGMWVYLLLWWRRRHRIDLVLCGLMAGAAVWTKQEGLEIAAMAMVCLAAYELFVGAGSLGQRFGRGALGISAAGVFSVVWLVFLVVENPLAKDFLPVTPMTFVTHLYRLPTILSALGQSWLNTSNWGVFWPALASLLLAAVVTRRLSTEAWALLLLLLAQLSFNSMVFVFSDLRPWTIHLQQGLPRLFAQTVPLAFLLMVNAAVLVGTGLVVGGPTLRCWGIWTFFVPVHVLEDPPILPACPHCRRADLGRVRLTPRLRWLRALGLDVRGYACNSCDHRLVVRHTPPGS